MIELESCRDWANEVFVKNTMHAAPAGAHSHPRVAIFVMLPRTSPAAIADRDSRQDASHRMKVLPTHW